MYVVYYSGHGQKGTGAWLVTEDEALCFQELLELSRLYAVPFGKLIVVIADSCYSGAWCELHKQAFNRDNDRLAASNLIVFAAAQPLMEAGELDDGGDFTKWLLTQLSTPLYSLFENAKKKSEHKQGNQSFTVFEKVASLPTRILQKPMASGLSGLVDADAE